MKGKDIIKFIQDNHLEDAIVTVTATEYYVGDHSCKTTEEVSISSGTKYIHIEKNGKRKGIDVPTIDFYVDSNLY